MANAPYPGGKFNSILPNDNIIPESPSVDDLIYSINALPEYGDKIVLHNNQVIIDDFYTETLLPNEKSRTHFQGVLRIPSTNYFYISGADVRNVFGQLFIGKVGSYISDDNIKSNNIAQRIKGPIGSNVIKHKHPPIEDHLIKVLKFNDHGFYHAGGMDMEGSIIAVPLENESNESIIKFLNVGDNVEEPKVFPDNVSIIREDTVGKAGAAGLIRLSTGRYLCGVWSDSDDQEPRIDLYHSVSDNIMDGFKQNGNYNFKTIYWSDTENTPDEKIQFQNIQFFKDENGEIFVLSTDNSAVSTPVVGGINRIHILQLKIKDHSDPLSNIRFGYIKKNSLCRLRYAYNLRAGAGFYINHLGQLALYAVAHWRTKDRSSLSLGEWYRPINNNTPEIDEIDFSILEMYEDDNFGFKKNNKQRKRCLKLYGKTHDKIDDFKSIYVQDKDGFNGKVSSIKYIIPAGWKVQLYEKDKCLGPHFDLNGTGKYESYKDLKNEKFGDKIRSLKFIKK